MTFQRVMDGYTFKAPSRRKGKKYDAFNADGKHIASFGALGYQQFSDRIGHYRSMNHNDFKRLELYYARHGREAQKESPKWFSHRYLW